MFFSSSLITAAMFGIALAQTPVGFTPQAKTKLDVIFNSTMVNTPGQILAKAAVATQPQIAIASASLNSTDTYMFIMLDIDIAGTGTNTTRRVLLHAMDTGFKPSQQKVNGTATLLTTTTPGPAPYISPNPPATDTIAHRYVQLLFVQPANLKVQALNFTAAASRMDFNIMSFMTQQGLSAPVAGNYFQVDGRAAGNVTAAATGTGIATGARPTASIKPFEGAAGKKDFAIGLAGLLSAFVVFTI